jgi:hypothetical protein
MTPFVPAPRLPARAKPRAGGQEGKRACGVCDKLKTIMRGQRPALPCRASARQVDAMPLECPRIRFSPAEVAWCRGGERKGGGGDGDANREGGRSGPTIGVVRAVQHVT